MSQIVASVATCRNSERSGEFDHVAEEVREARIGERELNEFQTRAAVKLTVLRWLIPALPPAASALPAVVAGD